MDGTVSSKQDVIDLVLRQSGADKQTTVMVGDTKFDLIGADIMGIDAIGVTYGFGARDELCRYPHIAIIDDISHIVNYL